MKTSLKGFEITELNKDQYKKLFNWRKEKFRRTASHGIDDGDKLLDKNTRYMMAILDIGDLIEFLDDESSLEVYQLVEELKPEHWFEAFWQATKDVLSEKD